MNTNMDTEEQTSRTYHKMVKARSEKARANRMTEVDGLGSGMSKHKGGSRSISRLVNHLSQTQGLPWDAYSYETFRTLYLKPDGTPLTPKDAKIEARVQELAAEEEEGADRNAIYKKIAIEMKLIKKGGSTVVVTMPRAFSLTPRVVMVERLGLS